MSYLTLQQYNMLPEVTSKKTREVFFEPRPLPVALTRFVFSDGTPHIPDRHIRLASRIDMINQKNINREDRSLSSLLVVFCPTVVLNVCVFCVTLSRPSPPPQSCLGTIDRLAKALKKGRRPNGHVLLRAVGPPNQTRIQTSRGTDVLTESR